MSVEFVADAEVVNGTAGTSVVVPRPAGTENEHLLLAFVAATGTPTITPPAGWELIGVQDAATNVRMAAYWKAAAVEPASWSWTLGGSQRNWGWVGAYSGVDLTAPVAASAGGEDIVAGTDFQTANVAVIRTVSTRFVSAVAAVRAAGGAATTWTAGFDIERADVSTNAGAGTDISGVVADGPGEGSITFNVFTASQSQTHGAMWSIVLAPAFTSYDGRTFKPSVEAAFGFDATSDPDTWTWTDITSKVRAGVHISKGSAPDAGRAQPSSLRFALTDPNGDFVPDNALGLYHPHIVPGTPIRVSVPFGYDPPTERITAFVESWEPNWSATPDLAIVNVTAYGRLYELQQRTKALRSPLYRHLTRPTFNTGVLPFAHWSLEDGAAATQFAASMPNIAPLRIQGVVNLASASDLASSEPLPVMTVSGGIVGEVSHSPTGQIVWLMAVKTPPTPVVSRANMFIFETTGTARYWALDIVPGSPDTFNVRALDADQNTLLDAAVAVDEAEFYGAWMLLLLALTQDGADVDYKASYYLTTSGSGSLGTLSSRTIGSARRPRIPNLADMAIGHLTLYTDPAYEPNGDPIKTAFTVLDGNVGEWPPERWERLCREEGISQTTYGVTGQSSRRTMGPQGIEPLAILLQQVAEAEQGTMHDGGPNGDLALVNHAYKQNRDVTLTLTGKQLDPHLLPKRDTSTRITDSTVSRKDGSSARYAIEDAKAPREEGVTLNLENDVHLRDIAAWRVRRGTAEGMRYPQIPFSLRTAPELTAQWLDCLIGSRINAIELPASHGPAVVDGILDGYTEEIDADKWRVTPNCSPAEPYTVGVIEDPELGRLDTDGSSLLSAVDSDDTALTVTSVWDPWITTAGYASMFPFDIRCGGERMTVIASESLLNDLFTRSVSNGWTGGGFTYALQSTAGDYDVGGTTATIQPTTLSADRSAKVTTGATDHDLAVDWQIDALPASGALVVGLIGRQVDDLNRYHVDVSIATTGVVTMRLIERIGGPSAVLLSVSTQLVVAAATWYRMRVRITGSDAWGRVWLRSNTEPDHWMFGAVGLVDALPGATLAGVFARNETAATTHVFTFDNFEVLSPQALTVTRSVNGVAKAQAAGEALSLWTPMRLAL